MVWANWVNALVGVWFVLSPFVLGYSADAGRTGTSIVGGLILLILGAWAASNEDARRKVWIQYVNGLVGIWFVISPWVLAFTQDPAALWTSLIGGAIAVVLAAWLAFGVLPKEAATK
jgi:hypothetical protein